jgi:hypothetical protein
VVELWRQVKVGMAIVSFSDIFISFTLIVNALALMTPNYYHQYDQTLITSSSSSSLPLSVTPSTTSPAPATPDYFIQTALRFKALMLKIRRLSCLLIIWNILFLFLMAFVFP